MAFKSPNYSSNNILRKNDSHKVEKMLLDKDVNGTDHFRN